MESKLEGLTLTCLESTERVIFWSPINESFVYRLRSPYKGYTVDRRMLCTRHRKALKIKWAMSVAGKICSCQWASALSLQPMVSLRLCFSHRATLMRG
jgi:hypothetical protein